MISEELKTILKFLLRLSAFLKCNPFIYKGECRGALLVAEPKIIQFYSNNGLLYFYVTSMICRLPNAFAEDSTYKMLRIFTLLGGILTSLIACCGTAEHLVRGKYITHIINQIYFVSDKFTCKFSINQ